MMFPPLSSQPLGCSVIVAPQNIAGAIAIEVASAGNLPVRGHHAEQRHRDHLAVFELPEPHLAACLIAPEDVARAIAIEVAGAGGLVRITEQLR